MPNFQNMRKAWFSLVVVVVFYLVLWKVGDDL